MKINVQDKSHDYSMHLRYDASAHYQGLSTLYWFDIVDNTELNF